MEMTSTQPLSQRLTPARLDREEGYQLLDLLQDRGTQQATLPGLEDLVPGFADWVVTALFGGTYQRPGLSLRDRQLVNLAALTTLGGVDPQLTGHVKTALRVGMTREEVLEIFAHLAPYVGVPKAQAGLRVAAAALADMDESDLDPAAPPLSETDARTEP
jgi:4-carboxymuconolactone decarboxylase